MKTRPFRTLSILTLGGLAGIVALFAIPVIAIESFISTPNSERNLVRVERYIVDERHVFHPETVRVFERRFAAFEKQTGIRILVMAQDSRPLLVDTGLFGARPDVTGDLAERLRFPKATKKWLVMHMLVHYHDWWTFFAGDKKLLAGLSQEARERITAPCARRNLSNSPCYGRDAMEKSLTVLMEELGKAGSR